MNNVHVVCFGVLATAALLPLSADAVIALRHRTQMAPGACQPFVPTSQVRYNASGIINAGTSLMYVVCSAMGSSDPDFEGGSSSISLAVTNNGSTTKAIACTARPGTPVQPGGGQLASSASLEASPGETKVFVWTTEHFNRLIGNANFTCALPPGVTLNHLRTSYWEEIGT